MSCRLHCWKQKTYIDCYVQEINVMLFLRALNKHNAAEIISEMLLASGDGGHF